MFLYCFRYLNSVGMEFIVLRCGHEFMIVSLYECFITQSDSDLCSAKVFNSVSSRCFPRHLFFHWNSFIYTIDNTFYFWFVYIFYNHSCLLQESLLQTISRRALWNCLTDCILDVFLFRYRLELFIYFFFAAYFFV